MVGSSPGGALAQLPKPAPPGATVVVIVRHAEKAAQPAADPPLTAAGVVRARELAALLATADVQAVIATQLIRSQETARPTAQAHNLPIETIVRRLPIAEHAREVANAVRRHPGKTVLVVGHGETVAAIVAALGGPQLADLCGSDYSNLYTLILDGSSARFIRSTYGSPSPRQPEPGMPCPAP
ncbi:MAG TPA: phosphoglycerate mutase family protein [Gemmatimonadaceae bacterium]|nr:phosphoglycerate mutase family protein [Gemmatimonadaceae bacterium]